MTDNKKNFNKKMPHKKMKIKTLVNPHLLLKIMKRTIVNKQHKNKKNNIKKVWNITISSKNRLKFKKNQKNFRKNNNLLKKQNPSRFLNKSDRLKEDSHHS
jgi:hypothetical protein